MVWWSAHENVSPQILALDCGRCRPAGGDAYRAGAKLSSAADPAGHPLSAGRCLRPRRTPIGGQTEAPPWHGDDREHWWRRRLARCRCRRTRTGGRLHHPARRDADSPQRGSAQEPAALRSDQGPRSDCERGHQWSGRRGASFGPGRHPQGTHRIRQGQSRQAVLRPRRCRLDPAPDRRTVQVTGRNAGYRSGPLSRHGTGDRGSGQRAGADGYRRGDRCDARIPSHRQDAHCRCHQSHASQRRA